MLQWDRKRTVYPFPKCVAKGFSLKSGGCLAVCVSCAGVLVCCGVMWWCCVAWCTAVVMRGGMQNVLKNVEKMGCKEVFIRRAAKRC